MDTRTQRVGARRRGLDAVERIVYADVTPDRVVALEKTLRGYSAAAFPSTPKEAAAYGQPYVGVREGSVVAELSHAAELLGISAAHGP